MRRDLEFFDGEVLVLIHIAKKLKESLQVESILDGAGIDYYIEVDNYIGGVIFRTARAGAFFYLRESATAASLAVLKEKGIRLVTES